MQKVFPTLKFIQEYQRFISEMEASIPDEIQHRMFSINGGKGSFSEDMKSLIRFGNNEKVKSYIKDIKPSLLVDSNKSSLLHLAAQYHNYDIVKHLIESHFDINAEDASKRTPLTLAIWYSKFKTAELLIESNADIYSPQFSGKSVLQVLLNYSSTPKDLLKACFEKVQRDSTSDEEIAEKLSIAKCPLNNVVFLKIPNVTRIFMNNSGHVDQEQCRAAMILALSLKDKENILALLQAGVGIDLRQINIGSFLDFVCPSNNGDESCLNLISAFFEKVIDWSFLKETDVIRIESVFQLASKNVLQIFLDHNVHIHAKNKFPERDIILAIFGNCNAESRELLKHLEFDVESRSHAGYTALHYAVGISALADVKTLLGLAANPNSVGFSGRTPLFYVSNEMVYRRKDLSSDEKKIVELLLLAGADVQLGFHIPFSPTKAQMVLAQLAIDESLGKPIKQLIRDEINKKQESIAAYQTHCQQIEDMKATQVHGSVTLYDVLVADVPKIVNRIRDREILQAIAKTSAVQRLYFFYISKLEHSVKKILHAMDLREKAATFVCEVAGWPDSQYIVLDEILGFFTYKDLLVFDIL